VYYSTRKVSLAAKGSQENMFKGPLKHFHEKYRRDVSSRRAKGGPSRVKLKRIGKERKECPTSIKAGLPNPHQRPDARRGTVP